MKTKLVFTFYLRCIACFLSEKKKPILFEFYIYAEYVFNALLYNRVKIFSLYKRIEFILYGALCKFIQDVGNKITLFWQRAR